MLVIEWRVFLLGPYIFEFPILLDKYSLIFICTVTLISFRVMLFSISYISGDAKLEYFIYIVSLFVLSINFLICVPNLVMLLLGWDGLGLTSYILVIYYQNRKSLGAGMVTALTNRVGDALLILGRAFSIRESVLELSWISYGTWGLVGVCIMVGAITKRAQIPFSAWLPAAIAAPTPVSSLVHSSTLVTAGVYILVRFYRTLREFWFFCPFILFSGIITCGIARVIATFVFDLKKIIALSTLSQLGLIMMSLGMGLCRVTFFHLITHALFKALLFICAGVIIHISNHVQDIRLLGNVWWNVPLVARVFNIANLALCGFPFVAGFYSKDLILERFLMGKYSLCIYLFSLMTICLTAGYSVRLSLYLLWSPRKLQRTAYGDLRKSSHVAIVVLFLGAVIGGALGVWVLSPSFDLIILPLLMKVLGLILVFYLGVHYYGVVTNFIVVKGTFFLGSIWFLRILTIRSTVDKRINLRTLFYYRELSWIEILGGKGVLSTVRSGSKKIQWGQNLSRSQLLSLFRIFFLSLLCLY